jgi:hypothetical protein
MEKTYVERALFVVGQHGAGKSAHLKNMFLDWRFHTDGKHRRSNGRISPVALSNERTLLILSQSAPERGYTIWQWIDRIKQSMNGGRWCFAGALRAQYRGELESDALQHVQAFIETFSPERVRICFLSPDSKMRRIDDYLDPDNKIIPAIASMHNVECLFIDFRLINTNAMMMADFFDFA